MLTFLDFTSRGRLGNQMFRVASTIGIALENGTDYAFPEWYCTRSRKQFGGFFAKPLPRLDPLTKIDGKIAEKEFAYNPVVLPNGNFTLAGFFQNERYFKRCESLVREYFEPKSEVRERLEANHGHLLAGSCSIHVRRSDYLVQQGHHPVLEPDYYRRAMEFIRDRSSVERFLVFSDDPKWCEGHFGPECVVVRGNQEIEDMFLMSMCSHHIIANSSFSWWGAWLNPSSDKVVVSPSVWFGPNLKHHDTSDVIPKHWSKV